MMRDYLLILTIFLVMVPIFSLSQLVTPPNNTIISNLNQSITATVTSSVNTSTWIDWDNSLVGYWNFDSGNSTHSYDLSGNGNHGEYRNGAQSSQSNSIWGNNVNLDGLNDVVEIPDKNIINSNSGSISFWYYSRDLTNPDFIFYAGDSGDGFGDTDDFQIFVTSSGTLQVVEYYDVSVFYFSNSISGSKNIWTHGVFSWDNTKGETRLVMNGDQVNSDSSTGNLKVSTWGVDSLRVGAHFTENNRERNFNGRIDEVMIFNRELSLEEIKSLYNSQVNQFRYNATNLDNETQYNYSIYSINTSGYLLKETYNFYTNTSYTFLPITNNQSLFPSHGGFTFLSIFLILLIYFKKKGFV